MSTDNTTPEFDRDLFLQMHNALSDDNSPTAFAQQVVRHPVTDRITHINGNLESDEHLLVQFRLEPVVHKLMSYQKDPTGNTPVYVDQEYIMVTIPNDKFTKCDRPVTEFDKFRFRREYEAFATGRSQALVGTALNQLPGLTPSHIKELNHFGVQTIEQLAGLSDGGSMSIAGLQGLKSRAKNFLEQAKVAEADSKIKDELSVRDAEIEALKTQMAQMMALLQNKGAESVAGEDSTADLSVQPKKKYGANK